MSKELLLMVESVSNEKGVEKQAVLEALEAALAMATKKKYGSQIGARVKIDPISGEYETFRTWDVMADDDELEEPEAQIKLSEARAKDVTLQVGDVIEEPMASLEFGRIAAQIAKQVVMQKVREAERAQMLKAYESQMGHLVTGVVKKVTRDYLIVELARNAEAMLPREEMIPRENLRMNDRVRCYLYAIRPDARGAQIFVSRTRPEMLMELFKIEVPEIGEEILEIKGAARDPGSRAKIAVKTNDGRIDPIGACVGMRGSRVQAVSGELGGERIDIILWDANPAQLMINAMAPADVSSIMVDEETHTMDVLVQEEQLSQAIGRNGQNVRLARDLTGWKINVMTEAEASEKNQAENKEIVATFIDALGVDEDLASLLVQEGFTNLEEVAYVEKQELAEIEDFDDEIAQELQSRAKDVLLTRAISASDELMSANEPQQDLLDLEGMSRHLAYVLASRGIVSQEDLAEQSVDDLADIEDLPQEMAAELIMLARAPWFEAENTGNGD